MCFAYRKIEVIGLAIEKLLLLKSTLPLSSSLSSCLCNAESLFNFTIEYADLLSSLCYWYGLLALDDLAGGGRQRMAMGDGF